MGVLQQVPRRCHWHYELRLTSQLGETEWFLSYILPEFFGCFERGKKGVQGSLISLLWEAPQFTERSWNNATSAQIFLYSDQVPMQPAHQQA